MIDEPSSTFSHKLSDPFFRRSQTAQVNAGFDIPACEMPHQRPSRKISRRARRVGATTQAPDRAIEYTEPLFPGSVNICQRQTAGVVEMSGKQGRRSFVQRGFDHFRYAARRRPTDGVGQGDFRAAKVAQTRDDFRDLRRCDRPLIGAIDRA